MRLLVLAFGAVLVGAGILYAVRSSPNTAEINSLMQPLLNPRLVVRKKQRILEVFEEGKLVKTYKAALGFAPEGDKGREGDGKTPEGTFYVFTKNPKSRFHLSLGVSYPAADDANRGLRDGLITKVEYDAIIRAAKEKTAPPQKTALGGEIYIHGGGTDGDWTEGCIALANPDIEELFAVIPVGAVVDIVP